jgi:hypothetical protein
MMAIFILGFGCGIGITMLLNWYCSRKVEKGWDNMMAEFGRINDATNRN